MKNSLIKLTLKLVLLCGLLLLNFGNFIYLFSSLNPNLSLLIIPFNKSFSLICHEQEQKLFRLNSFQTLLCSRCSGIYLGALIALPLLFIRRIFIKHSISFFFFAVFLMSLDVIFYTAGIYKYLQWIALSTGLYFGFITLNLLKISIDNLFAEINQENF